MSVAPAGRQSAELARLHRQFGWRIEEVAELRDGVWVSASCDAAVSFPVSAHAALAGVEDRSLWFNLRNELVAARMRRTGMPEALWDVGAGNGYLAAHLRSLGIDVVAVEPAMVAARVAAERGSTVICGTLAELRLPRESLECVGMFDVVEHLERPENLLGEVWRVLRPGGKVVVSVPAMAALWSQNDEASGHFRRYTAAGLDRLLDRCGLVAVERDYCFAAAVPPLWLLRALPYRVGIRRTSADLTRAGTRQLALGGERLRRLARAALGLEERVRRRAPVALGTSIVGVYRRSDRPPLP